MNVSNINVGIEHGNEKYRKEYLKRAMSNQLIINSLKNINKSNIPVTDKNIMGVPDEITYDNKGSKFFIYSKKKYSITCERKFEIDNNKMIVGFTSKGCF